MIISAAIMCCLASADHIQQVPEGVRYKRASAGANSAALAKLKAVFVSNPKKQAFGPLVGKGLIIGPGLWGAMKGKVGSKFQNSPPATFAVPTAKGLVEMAGRVAKTPEQQSIAWAYMQSMTPKKPKPTIRKASAAELKYYWAICAWDIREPLFVLELGEERLLINLIAEGNDLRGFYVDRLPPIHRPQRATDHSEGRKAWYRVHP
ncbi:MAG: hypothetical protein HONBIEJF_02950 [Fimbriimonadaceae bacterium]|nr:hypothetical protein [Fimbriimonadaceae bacterium]